MPTYLDRLHAQYDEIRAGIDDLVNRAADENRDVSEDEQAQVDRDQARMTELSASIQHYTEIADRNNQVAVLRGRVAPETITTTHRPAEPDTYDVHREFPSMGHYASVLHRATVLRDPEAREILERATAHQVLSENPGIIPRPVLGPVLNFLDTARPFINSISRKALPAGTFDRPVVTQHVAVDKQAAEKTLTASQTLKVDKISATAATYAGHLNISRQDVKWTSPSILNLVFEDFAAIYAGVTDADGCAQFLATITDAAVPIADTSPGAVLAALYNASVKAMGISAALIPDTVWLSPDVWATLGSATNVVDAPVFPGMSPSSPTSGNASGWKMVVDGNFPASTMVTGPSRVVEWYEDTDGLMQVQEPDVLGQLVGYAGFAAFLNTMPGAFTKFTPPPPVGG